MLQSFFLILLSSALCHGRQFTNPVISGVDTPDPGVVFYNGLYYAVTTSNSRSPKKFPVHVSSDLQNWEVAKSFVFLENNHPVWSNDVEYWAPEIHILGEGQFRVYFTTRDIVTNNLAIGAAFSTNILGPYHALDRPLVLDPSQNVLDANLINRNGTLFLIWKGVEWIYGAELASDGLTLKNDEVHLVMKNDLPWEDTVIEGPWVIQRDGLFYLFYSGNALCGNYAVGVGRSKEPFGPYEKRGDPILVSSDLIKGPGHCSVVKDIDGVSDVMVFHGYKLGEVCENYPRIMYVQSMAWDSDGWPYMTN